MKMFLDKYTDQVVGVLTGFDRLVIRGHLSALTLVAGMFDFLQRMGILLKNFGTYVEEQTEILKQASMQEAKRLNRPIIYLPSGKTSKEDRAQEIAQRDGITEGLICIFKTVELCKSYDIFRNKDEKKLELVSKGRKCLFLYHYWIDPIFGFMSARIQTWFPFSIQICINGREFLARKMDALGIDYVRKENCFPWIEDIAMAQTIINSMLSLSWVSILDNIARSLNPAHEKIFHSYSIDYYWMVYQSEVATDVIFKSSSTLDQIFPKLVSGAICSFSALDVMCFLGKKQLRSNFPGQIVSNIKERTEGIRIKHSVNDNSVKAYNKQGNILRVETTINNPHNLRVYRPMQSDPDTLRWQRMRKGIADLHRRAEVSQKSNERYLDALATLDTAQRLPEIIEPVCKSVKWKKRSVRGLRPWTEKDIRLLETINRGEFVISGFCSKDILGHLFPESLSSPETKRRAGAKVCRMIRMLRAHGIIRKMPRRYRYQLTVKGRKIATAILQCQRVTVEQLNEIAA